MSELIQYVKDKIYLRRFNRRADKLAKDIERYGIFDEDDTVDDIKNFLRDITDID